MALLVALFLTFLFFLPNLLIGKIPFPADTQAGLYHPFRDSNLDGYGPLTFPVKNPLITDPILQTYPWRFQTIENFKNGQWPLWNPYSFSGQPLLANIQSSPFQLANIFFILPFNMAWAASIIIPSLLTTLFMYLFLRNLKISKIASIFAAVCLPFSGFFISWLSWGSIVATVMWLPLILLSINKLFEKISHFWFLILTFAVSQIILSGHWQAASYVLVAMLIFVIISLKNSGNLKPLYVIVVSFILSVLISSAQILPTLEFINLSARHVDQVYQQNRQDWFIPKEHLIQLIVPDFFGHPSTYNYWGVFNYGEFVSFIGIVPLTFAILALFTKNRRIILFAALAVLALLFGTSNPISRIPYELNLPFIAQGQPSRIIFLLDFALVALAAFGLDRFLKNESKIKSYTPILIIFLSLTVLFGLTFSATFAQDVQINTQLVARRNLIIPIATIVVLAVIFSLKFFKVGTKIIIGLIFLVTILELFRFGLKFTSFSKNSWIFPKTKTTEFLTSREKPFRILSTDRRIMHPNLSSIYGVESAEGYDPLYLLSYNQLVSSWQSNKPDVKPSPFNRIVTPQKFESPITNLLNVKYILTFDELANPNFVKVFEEGQTKVFENQNVLPRFYFVDQVIRKQSGTDELSALLSPSFEVKRRATSQEFGIDGGSASGQVKLQRYQDQSITLETSNERMSPLVISNVSYPGWQAYIDGQKAEIHKVNYLLQSVIVPAGQHQVELKFQPKSFYNGLYLSAVGVLITALVAALIWKRKFL